MDHPALKQLPELVRHSVRMAELRFQRIGLIDRPIAELGTAKRLLLVTEAYGGKALGALLSLVILPLRLLGFFKAKRLTETYLRDPLIRNSLLGPQTDDDGEGGGGGGGGKPAGRARRELAEA